MPATPTPTRMVGGLLLGLTLAGCAAGATAVAKRDLDVQTRMTDTVFLDPVAPHERTVYVDIRNTSDQPDLDIAPQVRDAVAARGYRVVTDPQDARFILQANVLQAGRASQSASRSAYDSGFGGTLLGGAAGGAAGYGLGAAGIGVNGTVAAIGGALAGAAVAGLADAYVQDTSYTIVTDVQVAERTTDGRTLRQTFQADLAQGSSGTLAQSGSGATDLRRYRTRIVSTAEQVNLEWPEAAPLLVAGLSRSIGGIF